MLLRENFEPFWQYRSVDWAGECLDEWCVQVIRSRIEPMKKVARMLRRHRPLLLNWVSRPRGDFGRRRRGFQQQSERPPIQSRTDLTTIVLVWIATKYHD